MKASLSKELIRLFLFVCGVALTKAMVSPLIQKVAADSVKSAYSQKSLTEAQLIDAVKIASESSNKRGPRMIDADTRLDATETGPGPRLTWFFTFPSRSFQGLDRDLVTEKLKEHARRQSCEIKKTLLYGATFGHVFRDRDGIEVARFDLTQADCKLAQATLSQ